MCPTRMCADGSVRNPVDCSCPPIELCQSVCEDGFVLDLRTYTCKPDCKMVLCPSNSRLNENTCSCELPTCNMLVACDPLSHVDPMTCTCIYDCPEEPCTRGNYWSHETCQCEKVKSCPIVCGQDQWRDSDHCVCFDLPPVPVCDMACEWPLNMDKDTCTCVQGNP